jgi:hypothetical protein
MPFLTTPERFAMEKGMLLVLERLLRKKFGDEGAKLLPEIDALGDADKFCTLSETVASTTTLDEVRRAWAELAKPTEPPKSKRRKRQ